ncbi:MAG: RagB/SusD family nutrient uptake outer membrane protein [Candidatus Pseudobacter hemicellulosilyticus]|uniref:RagB/SusD family nutrient uptake outer membrane protein n=1 Tax=Candidatus Pseudobacter hemicellulosilyticus TaxID=3121375 RepID=A0AAJ5WXC5_9BACT|nr:MAG: RagB/SusD family nutrient uptake outer membrane protein [Pseudobacter sp.]
MNTRILINRFSGWLLAGILAMLLPGCEKLLDVDMPPDNLDRQQVFANDATATAAVLGIYSSSASRLSATGNFDLATGGMTIYPGLSADELQYSGTIAAMTEFEANGLQAENTHLGTSLWNRGYSNIYAVNSCIESLMGSQSLTPSVKDQLLGECHFLRAYFYFYLVNLYGNVPLIATTDYAVNESKPRTPATEIYAFMQQELETARDLLTPDYPQGRRTRINRYAALSLLARVYLYRQNWEKAAEAAAAVIASGQYRLEPDHNNVFLAQSRESLWELANTSTASIVTAEGYTFLAAATPSYYLRGTLQTAFEPDDLRGQKWILKTTVGGVDYAIPYKYKQTTVANAAAKTENYVMIRYAEQFLIQAEASAQLNLPVAALASLDSLRARSGLPLLSTNGQQPDKPELLQLVEQERRLELFCEWGHRWLDLKRTAGFQNPAITRADELLPTVKTGWIPSDKLYPIPQSQINSNPFLVQNDDY